MAGGRARRGLLLSGLLLLLLLTGVARAQTAAWSAAAIGSSTQMSGTSNTRAVATDANGNVFVTGYFSGTVSFGTIQLSSAGSFDLFVAKYVPGTATWAWAQSGGGLSNDTGQGIAVSGSSVYVTGYLNNNQADANAVRFGSTGSTVGTTVQAGATSSSSSDIVVAKYTDNGTSATVNWTQVGGGAGTDYGQGIAVSGSSVYVTGYLNNDLANTYGVLFGGSGTTAGAAQQNGASTPASYDIVVAKYTDNGPSATLGWTQVGGGTGVDQGFGIAVSGSSVYVTGYINNDQANTNAVVFGGAGTTVGSRQQNGASTSVTSDVLVAKYSDNGTSATLGWTQGGGGLGYDYGYGIAVSGSSVYVTGFINNDQANTNAVVFGGFGTMVGSRQQNGASTTASYDVLLAKYTDAGPTSTVAWTQVGGGTASDQGTAVAVSGSSVYVTGYINNNQADVNVVRFGSTGSTVGTTVQAGAGTTASNDMVVAKYTDNGTTATLGWTQVGGGTGTDGSQGLAVYGTSVYAAGFVGASGSAAFGTATGAPLLGTTGARSALASLTDTGGTGAWLVLAAAANGGTSTTKATTMDTKGNVFVTGNFTGQVAFGSTVLSSAGSTDLFVAKYVPGTATWAWAQSGGGLGTDTGQGIAVSGSNVYVTGYITNTLADASAVRFGSTGSTVGTAVQAGASGTSSTDVLVAKYIDNGTSATLGWTQVGGGTGADQGNGIAASGSNVYMTGTIYNSTADADVVRFGGAGTTAGATQQNGANSTLSYDLVVAKYTDNGTTAALGWTQVGGGSYTDNGNAIAVNGTSVYVTGSSYNNTLDAYAVRFGGSGTTAGLVAQAGTNSTNTSDILVAKYTDNGTSAAVAWTQVGGGGGADQGNGIAVSGSSVYVTGTMYNTTTNTYAGNFGGSGTTAGATQQNGATSTASSDLVVAKYTDNGTTAAVNWTQVGGGTATDQGNAIAVSGTSVYVTGVINNTTADANAVRFGGSGTTAGLVVQAGAGPTATSDVVVAKYTDAGSSATVAWTQVGGGTGTDYGYGIAASGSNLFVVGSIIPAATFGTFSIASPVSGSTNFLGRFGAAPLPVELTAFTATLAPNAAAVGLAWATASEKNSATFEVERSGNGTDFARVGMAAAAGSGSAPHRYQLVDNKLPVGPTTLYYRLRQVDTDGTAAYSPVRAVSFTPSLLHSFALYPNPAHAGATLTGAEPGTLVRVFDALGRLVATAPADAAGTAAMALPAGLPAGVYVVRAGATARRLAVE